MKQYLTADYIASQIRLMRADPRWRFHTFLFVEGPTDEKIYERYIDKSRCRIEVSSGGKKDAISVLSVLEEDNFMGILAIVDADFDVLEGNLPTTPNLLFTDAHDLEMMMIKSPAFDKFLVEFGSKEKIDEFVKRSGKDIVIALVELGIHLGYLRWVSLRENLSLKFEDLSFDKFLDKEILAPDVPKMIRHVQSKTNNNDRNRSQRPSLTDNDVHDKLKQLKSDSHDPWHVCCGHDLVCVLSFGLRKVIGTNDTNIVKPEVIERSLRLAYERSHFCKTQLYVAVQKWEKTNHPFVVLSAE